MTLTRYLGAAWAALYGPADPRRLCIWTLERGFRGLVPAPTSRPIDWPAVRDAAGDLPFDLGSWFRLAAPSTGDDRPDRGLGSKNRGDRLAAIAVIRKAITAATAAGLSALILEPGAVPLSGEIGPVDLAEPGPWNSEQTAATVTRRRVGAAPALDGVCRSLFALAKSFPDHVFCLTASRTIDGLGTPDGLEMIFEDLPRVRLAYWHEAALCACRQDRLGEAQGEWLERFGPRLAGVSLGDWSGERLHDAPGSGLVDYPLLASYLVGRGTRLPAVLELDPAVPPAELVGVRAFLDKFGL